MSQTDDLPESEPLAALESDSFAVPFINPELRRECGRVHEGGREQGGRVSVLNHRTGNRILCSLQGWLCLPGSLWFQRHVNLDAQKQGWGSLKAKIKQVHVWDMTPPQDLSSKEFMIRSPARLLSATGLVRFITEPL